MDETDSDTPSALRFSVLGPVRAWRDGAEMSLGSPQQLAVLTMLLLRRGRPVTVDEIVAGVWDSEPPRSSVAVVRTYVTRLRRLLEPRRAPGLASRLLVSVADGYALRIPVDAVDLPVVERLAERARRLRGEGQFGAAGELLAAALSNWDGAALAGVPGPYAERQRMRLNELRLATTEARLEADIECGRQVGVIGELYELTATHPLRERPRELLMRALYQAGRQADAFVVFADARRVLDEELGVGPGPGLREVHERILRADPALATPEPAPALVPVPAQLPAVLPDFTGRDDVTAALTATLTSARDAVIAGIVGLGGVGKTSLAVRVANQVGAHYPDGQLHADLRGMSDKPADPAAVLAGFLRALGMPARDVPDGLDERAALFRTITAGRRILVLLDDVLDAGQVRRLIPGGTGCAVLLTGRRRLPALAGVRWVPLDVLDVDEAITLLGRIAGERRVTVEPAQARGLVQATGMLPLAVRIIASRLAARPHWTSGQVADWLGDERRRLAELRVEDLDVSATFELSYRQLDADRARAFRLLSVAGGPDLSLPAAAAILDTDEDTAARLIDSLVDVHLVQLLPGGRYRYHDLLRDFARQCMAACGRTEYGAAAERLVDFYLASARNAFRRAEPASFAPADTVPTKSPGQTFATADEAGAWLRSQYVHALCGAEMATRFTDTDTDSLADLMLMLVRLPDFGVGAQMLAEGARRVADFAHGRGQARAEGRARYVLARIAGHGRFFAEATGEVDRAMALARHADDRRTLEMSQALAGIVHFGQGRLGEAADSLRAALDQAEDLGDRQRMAITLGNLAAVFLSRGQTARAIELSLRGRALATEIDDPMSIMFTGRALARGLLARGDAEAAEALVREGLALAERLRFHRWEATNQTLLAQVQLRLGKVDPAVRHAERALLLGRSIGRPDSTHAALVSLGNALDAKGESERAAAAHREATEISRRFGWSADRASGGRGAHDVNPGAQSELVEDVGDVRLYRATRQVQLGRDVRIGQSTCDQIGDAGLRGRQGFPAAGGAAVQAAGTAPDSVRTQPRLGAAQVPCGAEAEVGSQGVGERQPGPGDIAPLGQADRRLLQRECLLQRPAVPPVVRGRGQQAACVVVQQGPAAPCGDDPVQLCVGVRVGSACLDRGGGGVPVAHGQREPDQVRHQLLTGSLSWRLNGFQQNPQPCHRQPRVTGHLGVQRPRGGQPPVRRHPRQFVDRPPGSVEERLGGVALAAVQRYERADRRRVHVGPVPDELLIDPTEVDQRVIPGPVRVTDLGRRRQQPRRAEGAGPFGQHQGAGQGVLRFVPPAEQREIGEPVVGQHEPQIYRVGILAQPGKRPADAVQRGRRVGGERRGVQRVPDRQRVRRADRLVQCHVGRPAGLVDLADERQVDGRPGTQRGAAGKRDPVVERRHLQCFLGAARPAC
jgi:DNA-binding SARP family transcriptional activator/tetratricopeptide (TPR) repeat protein